MARGSIVRRTGKRKVNGKPAVYYYAVYYVGAKQKWEKAPHPGRKEDAQSLLTQRLRELEQGEYREVQKATFAEFAAHWLSTYVDNPHQMKRSSADRYRRILNGRLLPYFGEYPLTGITTERVQAFVSDLAKEGLSPKTVQSYLIPLQSMFTAAIRQGYIKRSPVDLVQKPKLRQKETAFLSAVELRRFLAAVDPEWRTFFTVLGLTGMRLGEALGMRWKNLDFDAGVYNVTERLYEAHFDTPKSDAGRRRIDLSGAVLEALRTHKAEQAQHRLESGGRYSDEDLVFCAAWGIPITNYKPLRHAFAAGLKAAGCPAVRIHDLRHTYASLLIAQGENPKYIQRQLGHASIQMTFDVYGHLMPDVSRAAVEKLDKQVFGTAH